MEWITYLKEPLCICGKCFARWIILICDAITGDEKSTLCPSCSEDIPEESIYCLNCGTNLQIRKISLIRMKNHSTGLDKSILEKYLSLQEKIDSYGDVESILKDHQDYVESIKSELRDLEEKLSAAGIKTRLEAKDVERLKSLTWASVKARIKGEHEEMLSKEEKEYFQAVSDQDVLRDEVDNLRNKRIVAKEQLIEIEGLEKDYRKQKEELDKTLREIGELITDPEEDKLENQEKILKSELKELKDQAYRIFRRQSHAQSAVSLYGKAKEKLSSAMNYADWDTFFGGGMIVDSLKRSRMGDASSYVTQANHELQQAIEGNPSRIGARVQQSSYLSDTLFDSIWTDYSAREKVKNSMYSVDVSLSEAREVQKRLTSQLDELKHLISVKQKEYDSLYEKLTQLRVSLIETHLGKA